MDKKLILAYYKYTTIENPHREVLVHKKFFKNRDAKGRIYLSEEGINGSISASEEVAISYVHWMQDRKIFSNIDFKIHEDSDHAFDKMTVKYRKQLVALNTKAHLENRGKHVSPKKWKEMLDSKEYVVLDVRNEYEWEIGHFENAEKPDCKYFRDFPQYIDRFKKKHTPDTKIMMCCTGGIRCETFSSLLKEEGYENVYQLDGGIIKYGLEEGNKNWKGSLFVFDKRLSVPIDGKTPTTPISHCFICKTLSDKYYNCANVECDRLFLCCDDCYQKYEKCCCKLCREKLRTI